MPITFPFTLPGDQSSPMDPVHDLTVAADAVAHLIQQYQKPNLQAFVSTLAAPAQDLEDVFFQLFQLRSIYTATGAQEDVVGRVVGQPRNGQTDAVYRTFLFGRVGVNVSCGTTEDIYRVFSQILSADYPGLKMSLVTYPPASFVLMFYGAALDNATAAIMANMLRLARSAGIGGQMTWSSNSPSLTFTLDTGPGYDVGHFGEASA